MVLCRKNSLLLCFSFATQQNTSDTSSHQMCVGFSPTKQFYDTIWVSYISILLWHCLPRNSIWSHKLRAQSHNIACLHFKCQSQVHVATCTFGQPVLDLCSLDPLFGFNNFPEWLTVLRESYLHLPVYYKRYDKG